MMNKIFINAMINLDIAQLMNGIMMTIIRLKG